MGQDFLFGGLGNDTLSGDLGDDFLFGEEGDDLYVYSRGQGVDVITDPDGRNRLLVTGFSQNEITIACVGDDRVITFSTPNDGITIVGDCKNRTVRIKFRQMDSGSTR